MTEIEDRVRHLEAEIQRMKKQPNLYKSPMFPDAERRARPWTYLTTPLTSTSWDGDSFSTTAKTLIDLSAVFGVPAGVKAVMFAGCYIRDSASAANDCWLILGPTNTNLVGNAVTCQSVNDRPARFNFIVPCDANGDIYYQCAASGVGTLDIFLHIWGYLL